MENQKDNFNKISRIIKHKSFIEIFGEQTENKKRLILGTCMQESRFVYRYQLGDGPARGFGQVETNTAHDIFVNYLTFRKDMMQKVLSVCNPRFDWTDKYALSEELAHNDLFNVVMLRLCYWRIKEAVPTTDKGLARYWKKYYNTEFGAGTVDEFMHSLKKLDDLK